MAKVPRFLLTVMCFLICTLALGQTVLTNDQILEMVNAKLTSSLIIGQIRNSKTNFDLSTSQMIPVTSGRSGRDHCCDAEGFKRFECERNWKYRQVA